MKVEVGQRYHYNNGSEIFIVEINKIEYYRMKMYVDVKILQIISGFRFIGRIYSSWQMLVGTWIYLEGQDAPL